MIFSRCSQPANFVLIGFFAPLTSSPSPPSPAPLDPLPTPYHLFFTLLEPFLTLLGSFWAVLSPSSYFLNLIPLYISPLPLEPGHAAARQATQQLGSCFFLFAIFGCVLLPTVKRALGREEGDRRKLEGVVRAYLGCLAAADVTHILLTLHTLSPLFLSQSPPVPYAGLLSPWKSWNALVWGNVGITAGLFTVRMMWFAGVGRRVKRNQEEEGGRKRE
ncbi:hypothetical protein JCM8547_008459 [Rhodosporidiobolus lusitaniae]